MAEEAKKFAQPHLIEEGDGSGNFGNQLGGGIPSAVQFERGNLFNLGATNISNGPNFVSVSVGLRSCLANAVTAEFSYEILLTDEEDSLMKNRFTADLTWTFEKLGFRQLEWMLRVHHTRLKINLSELLIFKVEFKEHFPVAEILPSVNCPALAK